MTVEGALLALVSDDDRIFWWIALGAGLAVVAVVVALLVLLLRLIADIDEQVAALAPATEELCSGTPTARRLSQAAATVEELRSELLSQRELMENR